MPGVAGIHALHTWCLTPGENVLTVHVVVDDDRDPICVAANVRARITEVAHVRHVTVQPERRSMSCRCEESPCPS